MTANELPNDYISIRQFREAEGTQDWPILGDGATAFFPTDSFAQAARFIEAIAALTGIDSHQPDIDIRDGGVTVRLLTVSDDWWALSQRDIDLARRISAVAAGLGLAADPTAVQSVGPIVIGASDIKKVMPFWQALMGYRVRADSPEEDLVDARDRGPGIWFERLDQTSSGRNRMHVAVWVPFEQAASRVEAAIAAGGRVIYDQHAPAWWTLADPEGNEADVSTSRSRDE